MEIYNRIPKEYSHLLGILYESKGYLVILRMITRLIDSNYVRNAWGMVLPSCAGCD
jgi:hypothetical protein